jgi:hypothetical protein
MAELSPAYERQRLIDQLLSEVSFFAQTLCPEADVEATTERYEDEDGHVRIYPPAGLSERQIEELELKVAERCVEILLTHGIFLCTAVYEADA